MEISPYKFNQPGGDPKPDFVHVVSIEAWIDNIYHLNILTIRVPTISQWHTNISPHLSVHGDEKNNKNYEFRS